MIGMILMAPAILLMIDNSQPTQPSKPAQERKFLEIKTEFQSIFIADTGFFNSRNWFKCSYVEDEPKDKSAIPRRKGRLSRAADKSALAAGSAVKFALLTPFILASNIKGKVDDIKEYK